MKPLKVILFDKNTKVGQFVNYGLGKIVKLLKCEVVEELNGRFDTELLIHTSDTKQKLIKKWSIIFIDNQLFRVVTRTDIDKDNTVKIYAKHIFYDVNNGFIIDNRADNKNVLETMQIAIPADFKDIFTVSSDIEDKNSIYFVKNNGAENIFNIIERWGQGELIRDNFNIAINKSKGADKGVTFTYSKIEAIEVDEDVENVVTRLYPSGKDGITLEEHYVTIPGWNTEEYPPFHITKEIKFEGAESTGELRVLARKEAEKIGLSRVNFKINVHDLSNSNFSGNIESLKSVEVGDIVTIKHHVLDVRVKVKCIKKTHEKISNKLTLEFGQPLENFFSAVDNNNNQITIPDTGRYEEHMFFYFNDSAVTISKTNPDLCFLRYGVTETTNLMLYLNLFFNCNATCEVKVKLRIDNVDLTFSPEFTIEAGKRSIAFTYPLINTEGNKAHTLLASLEINNNSIFNFSPENIQIAIRGQNVSGSMKVAPHAEVEEVFILKTIESKKLHVSNNSSINKKIPNRFEISEAINLVNIDKKILERKTDFEITLLSMGYYRPIDKLNYIYDKNNIEIVEGSTKVKTVENVSISKICERQFENGVLQELTLIDSTDWFDVKGGEFINNGDEILNK